MSVHNRAAVAASKCFSLTVCRYFRGCAQYFEFEGLTEGQVEAEKKRWQQTLPAGYEQAFEVTRY